MRLLQLPESVLFPCLLVALLLPLHGEDTFVRGDFNADGDLDIADPMTLLFHLFRGSARENCLDAGDANDDGELNISDALYALEFLFVGGRPPGPPYPECGGDPTLDTLDCSQSAICPAVKNEIVAIRRGNAGIEMKLYSDAPFPARALAPVLCVGGEELTLSRHPADGSPNTIIFLLAEEEFARTRDGDLVTVQHGACSPDLEGLRPYWDLWIFGPLDRSLLQP